MEGTGCGIAFSQGRARVYPAAAETVRGARRVPRLGGYAAVGFLCHNILLYNNLRHRNQATPQCRREARGRPCCDRASRGVSWDRSVDGIPSRAYRIPAAPCGGPLRAPFLQLARMAGVVRIPEPLRKSDPVNSGRLVTHLLACVATFSLAIPVGADLQAQNAISAQVTIRTTTS